MKDGRAIEVTVLDRTLKIACKEDEKADLLRRSSISTQRCARFATSGKVLSVERDRHHGSAQYRARAADRPACERF